ncbi:hypothetical protein BM86_24200 [Bacillus thuringiensis]|uniref:Insecticidal binary-like toxin n=1 Tax=Bacillus thuringiensis TaxID=1428 RepID=A0A9W3SJ23_BACTU|nr:hypothetical protein [Bacillus thuringiensis]ANS52219.1 putative insecticidal binary-like toxin [Bacillus thuringiensis]MBH0338499.1 hypothetical protein [Bacillus thuringiensis]
MNIPEKQTKYLYFLKMFQHKIIKIHNYTNGMMLISPHTELVHLYDESLSPGKNWIIYPLDGGKYIFANLYNGFALHFDHIHRSPTVCTKKYHAIPQQHWSLETMDTHLNYHLIRNIDSGLLIKAFEIDVKAIETEHNEYGGWWFEEVQSIRLPTISSFESIDSYPQYTNSSDLLPAETIPRLIGSTLIPAIMIQENGSNPAKQIQISPYYLLEKYQYWKKIEEFSLLPGKSLDSSYLYGMIHHDQNSLKETIGIKIHQDGGIHFTNKIYPIKEQLLHALHMSESQTSEPMQLISETSTYENNCASTLFCTKYILTTKLVLKRTSQYDQAPDIEIHSWIYTDPQTIQTTCYVHKKL